MNEPFNVSRPQAGHALSDPLTKKGRVLVFVGLVVVAVSLWVGVGWWNTRWHQRTIDSFDVQGTQVIVGTHCEDEARLRVKEYADRVELTFEVRGGSRGDCDDTVVAPWSGQLGNRVLLDTATKQPPLRQ